MLIDVTNPLSEHADNRGLIGAWYGLRQAGFGDSLTIRNLVRPGSSGRHGTFGTQVSALPKWRPNPFGGMSPANIDLNGEQVTVPTSVIDTSEGTIIVWVKKTSSFGLSCLCAFRNNGSNEIEFTDFNGSGGLGTRLVYAAGGTTESFNTASLTVGVWEQRAITWSVAADRCVGYANGVEFGSSTGLGTFSGSISSARFGNDAFNTYFNGCYFPARIYNRAVSAALIARDHQYTRQGIRNDPRFNVMAGAWTFGVIVAGGGPTYTLTCATGSFTLTGNATALQVARKLPTAVGSFTLTGNATNLVATRKLPTTVGNFTLTGNATALQVARKLVTEVANFTLTGNNVNLVYAGGPTYTLTCDTGSFSLTGVNVGFIASRKLATEAASYTLTGNAAGLVASRKLATQAGSFTLTGNATTLQVARKLITQAASFILTGIAVTLTYSGAPAFVNKILTTSTIGRIIRTTSNIARKVRT